MPFVLLYERRGRRKFVNQIIACCVYPFLSFKNLTVMSARGVSFRESKYSVKESIDRVQSFLTQHGATIYARIDQQAEVRKTGLHLMPLEFILFGNPKGGGPLMAENPLVALDLPLKLIAWEDDQKKVWLAWNKAEYIEERYSMPRAPDSVLNPDHIIDMAVR
jgi:uncharacterized protein (DUF302 family)